MTTLRTRGAMLALSVASGSDDDGRPWHRVSRDAARSISERNTSHAPHSAPWRRFRATYARCAGARSHRLNPMLANCQRTSSASSGEHLPNSRKLTSASQPTLDSSPNCLYKLSHEHVSKADATVAGSSRISSMAQFALQSWQRARDQRPALNTLCCLRTKPLRAPRARRRWPTRRRSCAAAVHSSYTLQLLAKECAFRVAGS